MNSLINSGVIAQNDRGFSSAKFLKCFNVAVLHLLRRFLYVIYCSNHCTKSALRFTLSIRPLSCTINSFSRLARISCAKRENELIVQDNGLMDKVKRKADFVQWFEQYITYRKRLNKCNTATLKHLRNFADEKPLSFCAITPELIKEFMMYLLSKVGENTAADYIKKPSPALEEAVRQDIIMQNPIRKIPRHERIKRTAIYRNSFTLDELQLLSDTPCKIKPQYKQAFLFSCFTGLRWSDVNPLRWTEIITKNIDGQEEWFIYFEQEKTEDIEYLPLSDGAVEILKERKRQQIECKEISPFVFPRVKETNEEKGKMHKRVWYFLKKWAVAAGYETKRMHFHTGRHTFATNVLENSPDGDLWTVSKLLGHKNINSTQIYAHVRDKKKSAAVKALPTLNFKHSAA